MIFFPVSQRDIWKEKTPRIGAWKLGSIFHHFTVLKDLFQMPNDLGQLIDYLWLQLSYLKKMRVEIIFYLPTLKKIDEKVLCEVYIANYTSVVVIIITFAAMSSVIIRKYTFLSSFFLQMSKTETW